MQFYEHRLKVKNNINALYHTHSQHRGRLSYVDLPNSGLCKSVLWSEGFSRSRNLSLMRLTIRLAMMQTVSF